MKRKSIKSRNIEKIQTPYDFKDILKQNYDNEPDKTNFENEHKFTNKRDNSLDIVRNNSDNYEVVLPYQRYVRRTK